MEHATALAHRTAVHSASMDFAGADASVMAVAGRTSPVQAYQVWSNARKTGAEESPRLAKPLAMSVPDEHPSLSLVFAVVDLAKEAETGTEDCTAEVDIVQVYCLVVAQV